MKCALNGANSRILAKTIQSLSKFGRDIFIEADQDGLQLRTVNANKSAVGSFKFSKDFFDSYELGAEATQEENYCRLSMKPCLGVFKSMRMVETCEIAIDVTAAKFLVQMNCRHETVKHFIISIIDEENISAAVPTDSLPNAICGSHKVFMDIAGNFHSAEEEITLEIEKTKLIAKNYVEGSRVNEKFLRTQMQLDIEEFDEYKISEEASVTFCIKEFKAFLTLADTLGKNINVLFSESGSPIIFQMTQGDVLEGTLIMSTLSPDDITMLDDGADNPDELTESFMARIAPNSASKRSRTPPTPPVRKKRLSITNAAQQSMVYDLESDSSQNIPEFRLSVEESGSPPNIMSNGGNIESLELRVGENTKIDSVPSIPSKTDGEVHVIFVETEEDNMDQQIPQSPEHNTTKRRGLRSVFSRCFEATYIPREPSPNSELFVPDSDGEA